jgi:hypothetical protein
VEDAQAEQIKPGVPKQLPFDEFQAMHLILHLPNTPGRREGGADCRMIAKKALRKAVEFPVPLSNTSPIWFSFYT